MSCPDFYICFNLSLSLFPQHSFPLSTSWLACLFAGDKILIFHHNLQINKLKILQCDFLDFFSHFVCHIWSVPMIRITDLYMLCKWENLQNRQCIKYLFSPQYMASAEQATKHRITTHKIPQEYGYINMTLNQTTINSCFRLRTKRVIHRQTPRLEKPLDNTKTKQNTLVTPWPNQNYKQNKDVGVTFSILHTIILTFHILKIKWWS